MLSNTCLLNLIRPEIEKILRKNQNDTWRNWSTSSQILTSYWIIKSVLAKNHDATLLFKDFYKAFDSVHREKMEQILQEHGFHKETITAIMMLYKNTKSIFHSSNGNTFYFDIITEVLQGDALLPCMFMICLDYIQQTGIAQKKQSISHTMTDVYFAEDIVLLTKKLA